MFRMGHAGIIRSSKAERAEKCRSVQTSRPVCRSYEKIRANPKQYLLQGSLILLLLADKLSTETNDSVIRACETIVRAHEAAVVTLNTEYQVSNAAGRVYSWAHD